MCMMRSYMNIRDYLVILIPSRDGRAFVDTVAALCLAAASLKKEPLIVCCDGLTYWDARNNVMLKLRRTLKDFNIEVEGGDIRGIWCDNDILIQESVASLAMEMRAADIRGANILGNYKTTWGAGRLANTIMFPNSDGTYRNATDSELDEILLPDGHIPKGMVGGLGFYYGRIPFDYEYHIEGIYKTEDIVFFLNNDIRPEYVPIKLLHSKQVFL